ncbi:MAG: hypothetical protein QNJ16_02210 [Rhodobacter sp.]|nr:hypothetical protein [Rhodobacter sp.]
MTRGENCLRVIQAPAGSLNLAGFDSDPRGVKHDDGGKSHML